MLGQKLFLNKTQRLETFREYSLTTNELKQKSTIKIMRKYKNIWNLRNMVLNNTCVREIIKRKIKNIFNYMNEMKICHNREI